MRTRPARHLPARLVASWNLEPRSVRSWLIVEMRQSEENSYVALRRWTQSYVTGEPTYIKGLTVGMHEIPDLIKALQEAAGRGESVK